MHASRFRTSAAIVAGLLVAGLVAGRAQPRAEARASAQPARDARVAHGEYLVKTGGCNDCHTPWKMGDNGPEPDMSRMLMGHPASLVVADPPGLKTAPWFAAASPTMTAWTGPWGRSFTSNLTPDKETGLGSWTEAQFIATIRNGRHLGNGRPLMPPMPWEAFRRLADDDLAAMFAYLKTIPAIANKVPDYAPPPGPAMPPPPPPPTLPAMKMAPGHGNAAARGQYLVTAKGCGDCHTPMRLGANGPEYDMSRMLSGYDARGGVPAMPSVAEAGELGTLEQAFAGGWGMSFAANLTPDPETGLGTWTEQQFVDTLRNGRHQGRGRELLPPMPWQVFGQMTDQDIKAVFAYLKSIPAVKNKVPDPVAPAR